MSFESGSLSSDGLKAPLFGGRRRRGLALFPEECPEFGDVVPEVAEEEQHPEINRARDGDAQKQKEQVADVISCEEKEYAHGGGGEELRQQGTHVDPDPDLPPDHERGDHGDKQIGCDGGPGRRNVPEERDEHDVGRDVEDDGRDRQVQHHIRLFLQLVLIVLHLNLLEYFI